MAGSPSSKQLESDDGRTSSQTDTKAEDSGEYQAGITRTLVFVSLCMAYLLVSLDNTIIATAIPRITDDFQSQDDIGWYGSAYLLAQLAVQLLFGKLYSFASIKLVFLGAIGMFEAGSLICGTAPTSTAFIVGRALAGIGGAGITIGVVIIISHTTPLQKRPIVAGLLGAIYGISSATAPLMGGAFTDNVTWRLCFYINLPVGAIAVGVNIFFFKSPRQTATDLPWKDQLRKMDIPGTAALVPAIISLLLALQWGGSTFLWSNWRIILLLVLSGLLICLWLGIQYWLGDSATVPPRLLKNKAFSGALWFQFCLGCYLLLHLYYIPIWFQTVQDATAMQSGIRCLPTILSLVLVSLASGAAVSVLGYYTPFILASLICTSIGAGLLLTWTPDTDAGIWIGSQLLIGIGVGLGCQMPLIVIQHVCSLADIPTGTSLMYFIQNAGGAIFLAVGQNVFATKLVLEIKERLPSLDPKVVLAAGATDYQTRVSAEEKPQLALAYSNALRQCFLVAVIMCCVAVFSVGLIGWKKMGKSNDAGHAAQTQDDEFELMEQND